ncbi:hypothetical protein BD410DRAFT_797641, partial [Rickenella mellea]
QTSLEPVGEMELVPGSYGLAPAPTLPTHRRATYFVPSLIPPPIASCNMRRDETRLHARYVSYLCQDNLAAISYPPGTPTENRTTQDGQGRRSTHLKATARGMTTRFSLTTLKALGHARMLGDYDRRLVDWKCFLSVECTGTANQMEIVKAAWKDGL